MYLTLKKIDRIIDQAALADDVRPFVSTISVLAERERLVGELRQHRDKVADWLEPRVADARRETQQELQRLTERQADEFNELLAAYDQLGISGPESLRDAMAAWERVSDFVFRRQRDASILDEAEERELDREAAATGAVLIREPDPVVQTARQIRDLSHHLAETESAIDRTRRHLDTVNPHALDEEICRHLAEFESRGWRSAPGDPRDRPHMSPELLDRMTRAGFELGVPN